MSGLSSEEDNVLQDESDADGSVDGRSSLVFPCPLSPTFPGSC